MTSRRHEPSSYAYQLRVAVGEVMKELREEKRLTKAAVCRAARVSTTFLDHLENGVGNSSYFRMADVAVALDTPLSEIVTAAEKRVSQGASGD